MQKMIPMSLPVVVDVIVGEGKSLLIGLTPKRPARRNTSGLLLLRGVPPVLHFILEVSMPRYTKDVL